MSEPASDTIATTNIVSIAKPYKLQFEQAQDSWVLLYPEGMVKLNGPAGEILKRCDGVKNILAVIDELESAFDQQGLQDDVLAFMEIALEMQPATLGRHYGCYVN